MVLMFACGRSIAGWLLIVLCSGKVVAEEYRPEQLMPYRKIQGTDSDVNIISNTVKCVDTRQTLRDCSEECFKKRHSGDMCVGFLTSDGATCELCEPTGGADHTLISPGHTLYLLQGEAPIPNIHLDMEGIDLGSNTVTGVGVNGTTTNLMQDDLFQGIIGQSVRFLNGKRIVATVDTPQCFCSADYCQGTTTVSFWIRPYSSDLQHILVPDSFTGLACGIHHYTPACNYVYPGKRLPHLMTSTPLVSSTWYHVTIVVDLTVGGSVYLDGVLDVFNDISNVADVPSTSEPSCSTVYIGVKDAAGENPLNADLDEIRYFYTALSASGIDFMFISFTI